MSLRLLLVERKFGQAWRLAGFEREPRIEAVDLEGALATVAGPIYFAQAGGVVARSAMDIAAALLINREMTIEEMELFRRAGLTNDSQGRPGYREFSLTGFLTSPSFVLQDKRIARSSVIKYVANRLGGAHFGLEGGGERDRALFEALDGIAENRMNNRRAVFYELLAIGGAVGASSDTALFLDRAGWD